MKEDRSVGLHTSLVLAVASVTTLKVDAALAVGDAYRQIGDAGSFRRTAGAKARQSYLTALFRARGEGSVDGVLRVAERALEAVPQSFTP